VLPAKAAPTEETTQPPHFITAVDVRVEGRPATPEMGARMNHVNGADTEIVAFPPGVAHGVPAGVAAAVTVKPGEAACARL
jgi:hypothetical protein